MNKKNKHVFQKWIKIKSCQKNKYSTEVPTASALLPQALLPSWWPAAWRAWSPGVSPLPWTWWSPGCRCRGPAGGSTAGSCTACGWASERRGSGSSSRGCCWTACGPSPSTPSPSSATRAWWSFSSPWAGDRWQLEAAVDYCETCACLRTNVPWTLLPGWSSSENQFSMCVCMCVCTLPRNIQASTLYLCQLHSTYPTYAAHYASISQLLL